MKIAVVSYSYTGNNEALSDAVAKALSADHIRIAEKAPRKTGTIVMDMMFNRTPRVQPLPAALGQYEQVLFVAPVWMGLAASPLRSYFKHLKANPRPYAFASISGGALNPNPKLKDGLTKRTGAKPTALIDLHIADLLPSEPKPTMKDMGAYRLKDEEIARLAGKIVKALESTMELHNQ